MKLREFWIDEDEMIYYETEPFNGLVHVLEVPKDDYNLRIEIIKEADRRFANADNFDSFVECFKEGAEWIFEHFASGSEPKPK